MRAITVLSTAKLLTLTDEISKYTIVVPSTTIDNS